MSNDKIYASSENVQEPNCINGSWGFDGVDLTDTYVLSWNFTNGELWYHLECSLWPSHRLYEEPGPRRYTCYKIGTLYFRNVTRIKGLSAMSECTVIPSAGDIEKPDFGCIDVFNKTKDNTWTIEGEFGTVEVSCDTPQLRISGAQI